MEYPTKSALCIRNQPQDSLVERLENHELSFQNEGSDTDVSCGESSEGDGAENELPVLTREKCQWILKIAEHARGQIQMSFQIIEHFGFDEQKFKDAEKLNDLALQCGKDALAQRLTSLSETVGKFSSEWDLHWQYKLRWAYIRYAMSQTFKNLRNKCSHAYGVPGGWAVDEDSNVHRMYNSSEHWKMIQELYPPLLGDLEELIKEMEEMLPNTTDPEPEPETRDPADDPRNWGDGDWDPWAAGKTAPDTVVGVWDAPIDDASEIQLTALSPIDHFNTIDGEDEWEVDEDDEDEDGEDGADIVNEE